MKIDVLTLFPKMLDGFISESILGRAVREHLIDLQVHNLRDWAKDARRTVDDRLLVVVLEWDSKRKFCAMRLLLCKQKIRMSSICARTVSL